MSFQPDEKCVYNTARKNNLESEKSIVERPNLKCVGSSEEQIEESRKCGVQVKDKLKGKKEEEAKKRG